MKERLLITTAIGLMLGTGAFAQITDRSVKKPAAARGLKSDQSKFVRAIGILVDPFSELDAVCPERATDIFG
jgi:hypothetical protein